MTAVALGIAIPPRGRPTSDGVGAMKRRQFVLTAAATFALLSGGCGVLPTFGRPATRGMWRVGILTAVGNSVLVTSEIAGLKQRLAELGYVDGKTIAFELRSADANLERLPELANQLIQLQVDVIFAVPSPSVAVAEQATRVIPIVFCNAGDPVGKGWVASLDHPGGNLTGVTSGPTTLGGKVVEFLAQLVPRLSRVVLVINSDPADPSLGPSEVPLTTAAANAQGIQLKLLDMRAYDDVEPVLSEALGWQAEAMVMQAGLANTIYASRLVDFQLQHRIPLAYGGGGAELIQDGFLLGYTVSSTGSGHTAARLVVRILKGTRPADLPVELPTDYGLVVNQTTARALGITIPAELAQQVTEWVQ